MKSIYTIVLSVFIADSSPNSDIIKNAPKINDSGITNIIGKEGISEFVPQIDTGLMFEDF